MIIQDLRLNNKKEKAMNNTKNAKKGCGCGGKGGKGK